MSWADLEWPDLSPEFPEPQPAPPPPRADVPADIGEQVQRAERRRGIFVPLCVLAGAILFCAGVSLYRVTLSDGHGAGGTGLAPMPAVTLLFMLVGLLIATLLPALVVLLVIGPSWTQRQQHLALLQWERARREWLSRERQRYLASLPQEARARVMAALSEAL